MAKTPHGTKGWIKYMEGAREFYDKNGTLNGYEFYKWNNQRWYPDNKSKVIEGQNFNPNRRIGTNLYSPKSYESKLKEISDRRSWHLKGRFTEQDYLDYAKNNIDPTTNKPYTKAKAKQLFKEMNAGLKKDKDLISKFMHDDHINAISLDEGFEHPRNKVILDAETNLKKSAMKLDDATQEAVGTYKTKADFLKADFEGVPLKGNLEKQRIVTEAVNAKTLDGLKSYDYINKQQLKAARFTGKAARYVLGPASVLITGALATDQARATEANPTVRNQILNVGRQLEAYTDAAGLATAATGIGVSATVPLEAASMLIGGLTDTYEALSGW